MSVAPHESTAALASLFSVAPVEQVNHPLLIESGVELFVKREDLLHPIISGNKWRKFKYILEDAFDHKANHLISMGGAWSNHLHALAYIGHQLGIKTTGIIRGEEPLNKSTTLVDIQRWGMNLVYVSREQFRELRAWQAHDAPPAAVYDGYWIPEGGANHLALRGVAEIMDDLGDTSYDTVTLACGTGTTLAGLASHSNQAALLGFAALKGATFLNDDVAALLPSTKTHWSINLDYHFGGFGKVKQPLIDFIQNFEAETDIALDPIYTGKMMFGLFDLIQGGYFERGHKILSIHTGGLQGRAGIRL